MKRKWLAGLTALTLTVTLLAPGPVSADEIDEKKDAIKERDKEIQRIEKERNETEKDLQSTFAELNDRKKELNQLNHEVYQTEQALKKSEKKLEEKEKQLEEQQRLFKERVRSIYQQGEMFYFQTLVDAGSIDEFLSRLEFVRQVAKRDQTLIAGYERDRKELAEERENMEELLAKRKEKSEQAQKLHDDLTAEYKKYEKDLSKLSKEQENLEEVNEEERKKVRDLVRKRQQERQRTDPSSGKYEGGKFLWPVKGAPLTSPYGMRYHPVRKENRMHTGIDLGAPLGTPILAAASGKVIDSRPASGYGYIIIIDHGGGLSTLYAHMYAQGAKVSAGQEVSKGQVIAEVGNNGWSTGPHLHFEVLKNGNHTDPMPYFKQ
ncbi:murein hydrolase activator EnvC family protein [Desmospora profundinema]|uniref:Murein DD-endopeptidase MepM/ murein hydrolase activator NlpD n=1 Tax=Desmospora profundinema TaxID=1571184 RepID=A0ABU1ILE7_9BACL|nr:peptidoglycan DD-metalloendopeptidase family protein [Desmospora profundinema]MDR6225605.1 murein DD-endopeptidase MepM/ murein hydrolase activator NlpD [Desmospora profundinema]